MLTNGENEYLELRDIVQNIGSDVAGFWMVARYQLLHSTVTLKMSKELIRKIMGIE